MTWQPAIGDTVRVVATERTGVVVHVTLTEWGFLYDVEHDGPPGGPSQTERRTYATGQLEPTDEPSA